MRNARSKPLPAIDYLRECFNLTKDGRLIWKQRPNHHFKNVKARASFTKWVGTEAGSSSTNASGTTYLSVEINQQRYAVHRIVYYMHTGDDPLGYDIDHRDGNGINNKPKNLKKATRSGNLRNVRLKSNNTSGICGVQKSKLTKGRWIARAEKVHIGTFGTKDAAIAARQVYDRAHGYTARHGQHQD